MELEAAEEGQGFGEVREKVGCEGREGSGVGVGLWEGGGRRHDGERKRRVVTFWNDDQFMMNFVTYSYCPNVSIDDSRRIHFVQS